MKLLGLDHIGIVVRDIDNTVARAGATVDGRAVGERFVSDRASYITGTEITVDGGTVPTA